MRSLQKISGGGRKTLMGSLILVAIVALVIYLIYHFTTGDGSTVTETRSMTQTEYQEMVVENTESQDQYKSIEPVGALPNGNVIVETKQKKSKEKKNKEKKGKKVKLVSPTEAQKLIDDNDNPAIDTDTKIEGTVSIPENTMKDKGKGKDKQKKNEGKIAVVVQSKKEKKAEKKANKAEKKAEKKTEKAVNKMKELFEYFVSDTNVDDDDCSDQVSYAESGIPTLWNGYPQFIGSGSLAQQVVAEQDRAIREAQTQRECTITGNCSPTQVQGFGYPVNSTYAGNGGSSFSGNTKVESFDADTRLVRAGEDYEILGP